MRRNISGTLGVVLAMAAVPLALPAQDRAVTASVAGGSEGTPAHVQVTGPDGKTQDANLTDGDQEQLASQIGQMMSGLMSLPEDLRNKLMSDGSVDLGDLQDDERAQVMRIIADGLLGLPDALKDKLFGEQREDIEKALRSAGAQDSDPSALVQSGLKNGRKVPIIILDSVRVGERELEALSQSLRSGKVRLRQNGVRTIPGNAPEARQYGAGPDDEVVVLSTEPGGPP